MLNNILSQLNKKNFGSNNHRTTYSVTVSQSIKNPEVKALKSAPTNFCAPPPPKKKPPEK